MKTTRLTAALIAALLGLAVHRAVLAAAVQPASAADELPAPSIRPPSSGKMVVPKIWDDQQLASWALPIAGLNVAPNHVSEREYYAVPVDNLRKSGLWYRGLLEHSGSVGTLEDWFDPKRLRNDYVPTGWKGPGVKMRAVKGHEYGLDLSKEDSQALIAFLRTL